MDFLQRTPKYFRLHVEKHAYYKLVRIENRSKSALIARRWESTKWALFNRPRTCCRAIR